MKLKIRKLIVSLTILSVVSLIITIAFRGSIFASDVDLTNNNGESTVIEKLNLPGSFTISPVKDQDKELGKVIQISKAYKVFDGDKVFGEMLLSDSSDCSIRKASDLMISRISDSYPLITRDRFENGKGNNSIIYREWGTVSKDDQSLKYQNLIIHGHNATWYLILYYKNPYGPDVDHMIQSVHSVS